MSEAIPTLSDEQIRSRVGDQSFQRGRRYADDGAIFAAFQQGTTLKAQCEGSHGTAYRLWVAFNNGGIEAAECSCPVGAGGSCKHIAALLLTWRAHPDEFVALEDLDTVLDRRDKSALIALIKQMLRQEPDLELLVHTPLPSQSRREGPLDPEVYYRHARAAFRRGGDEWGAESNIAAQLDRIVAIGDGFAAQGDHSAAGSVYMTVATAVAENVQEYGDEDGALRGVTAACIEGMGACLAATPGAREVVEGTEASRGMLLRTLFDLMRKNIDSGGIGFAEDAPETLLAHVADDEREMVVRWAREALGKPSQSRWGDDVRRNAYGRLLLDLKLPTLDDEAFLRLCRETGRTKDLIERLLALGRVDEAVEELRGVADYPLLGLADLFERHGQGAAVEPMLLERGKKAGDVRLLTWLKDRYVARGDDAAALELARRVFRLHASLEAYQDVRALAERRDRWEALRPTLLMQLTREHDGALLVAIYLDDGEIDLALDAVQEQPGLLRPDWVTYDVWNNLAVRVARAAEATRPRRALEVYRAFAEGLIGLQGRGHYQLACQLLARARDLSGGLGDEAAWAGYITALRENNRRLRALMQEMDAAGLAATAGV